ncbi:uncharacterized protein LOC126888887 [Diabrotica virgifera virgifera]|uniref:Protein sleepless n=1 Tax=Diabrotica virgifera virgifera TaxID=50390 RepID=A0ABM5KSV9_DIAVI|nr:uncharacterized protein LOC126888887 [Diabrotica virgifera virgifera]
MYLIRFYQNYNRNICLVFLVSALECYSCDEENCKKESNHWQTVKCDKPADQNQEPVCQKLTYKSRGGIEQIQRKCAFALKNQDAPCPAILHQNEATELKCPTCKTNLCNSAITINFSLTALSATIFAILGRKLLM